jgi:5-(carboxyamino)imidazole ribonucleotide synthase
MRDEQDALNDERRTMNEKLSDVHPSSLIPHPSSLPILPGAKIGVLGSGQLGRMFAMAARRMGYLVHTFSPDSDTPTGQVADVEITASYDDLEAVRAFARGVEVVTFEFENVPAATVEAVAEFVPVRPSGAALHTAQHRVREKTFLAQAGFPVTPFRHIRNVGELRAAVAALGLPCVLKTAGFGYDGKGQRLIKSETEIEAAFAALDGREAILEAFVDFAREVSVVCARGADGATAHYGVIENQHARHILDCSLSPAAVAPAVARHATEIAASILEQLAVCGVLCVEFFVTPADKLFVNEIAPRPHNSGHFTIDACVTSQFEQQVRAVTGLPLGTTAQLRPAAMANLLGDLWQQGEPDWRAALSVPNVHLHLYGKHEARVGRKMGHLTALAETTHEALRLVRAARAALTPNV